MPDKTRRGKKKHPPLGKKKKGHRVSPVMAAHQPPASPSAAPASAEDVSTPVVAAAPPRYPYIYAELRRIGILSVVILAILVALVLFLS